MPGRLVGVLPRDFHLLLPPETLLLRDAELWRPTQIPYDNFPRNLTTVTVFRQTEIRWDAGAGAE